MDRMGKPSPQPDRAASTTDRTDPHSIDEHPSHPAFFSGRPFSLTRLLDNEMKQASFLPPVHKSLTGPFGPDHHLNIGCRIVRYQVDYFTQRNCSKQIVESN